VYFSAHSVKQVPILILIKREENAMAQIDKYALKQDLVTALTTDDQVEKIVIFGSFNQSINPHDMDVAVFCDSKDDYLTLALALRKRLRKLSRIIPIDLLPISIPFDPSALFLQEINKGEVVYEKRH
jgi:predicted nucleotidyltransferase